MAASLDEVQPVKAQCSWDQEKQQERRKKGAEMGRLYAAEGGQAELRPLTLQTYRLQVRGPRGPEDQWTFNITLPPLKLMVGDRMKT